MTGTTGSDTAERVRAFRRFYGLNQTQLAELLDVTRQTVTNWERGYPMSRIARYALLHLDTSMSRDARNIKHVDVRLSPIETNGATHDAD